MVSRLTPVLTLPAIIVCAALIQPVDRWFLMGSTNLPYVFFIDIYIKEQR